jgi:3-oxoacyl-(acyl-carrier-protein) synthase
MPAAPRHAIVLTAGGWVSSRAAGPIDEVLAALNAATAAAPPGDEPLPEELSKDRGGRLAGLALLHARRSAAWQDGVFAPERVGLVLGCALAGHAGMIRFANEVRQQTPRFVSPLHFPQTVGNYVAGALARGFGLRGPNLTLASGGTSGLDALAGAFDLLAGGGADAVFAGAVTECPPDLPGGAGLGEGACLFTLERADSAAARGVRPLATMTGYTRTTVAETLEPAAPPALISCAACRQPGAVFIEHWIGPCPGTASVAAVAAVLGAAWGRPVPVLEAGEARGVSVRPIALPRDAATTALVRAASEAGHMTSVTLVIPPITADERQSPRRGR